MSMERFKRKLTLLDIPVFEIVDKAEIGPRVSSFLYDNGINIDKELCGTGKEPEAPWGKGQTIGNGNNLQSYTALLGVEESGILFIERNLAEQFTSARRQAYSVLLISERNIVESVEVALLRINSGSAFYGKQLEVIQPESLSEQSLVFILNSI